MIFQKGRHRHIDICEPLLNSDIKTEVLKSYVYLGLPFSQSAVFEKAFEAAISKANFTTNSTLALINRLNLKSGQPIQNYFIALLIVPCCMERIFGVYDI